MPRSIPSSTEARAHNQPEVKLDLDHSYLNPGKRKAKKPSPEFVGASGAKKVN